MPATMHWPEAPNEIDRPELAVALTVKSGSPYVRSGSGAKVIDWLAFWAVTVSTTCGAAL